MTYKHIKPEDSPTFRALEKIAISKGMIKNDPIVKKAEKQEVSSGSLTENILLLAQKLRNKGLQKYANEIEIKFLNFKKAEGLYDVSKETGENLIDTAHPDGGVKLDDSWDDLGTVETVVEQHKKVLDVINKMPKGKLASKNAINAVKILLAQEIPTAINVEHGTSTPDDKTQEGRTGAVQKYFLSAIAEIRNVMTEIMRVERLDDITYHDQQGEDAKTGLLALKSTRSHMESIEKNLQKLSISNWSKDNNLRLKGNLNALMFLINKAEYISPQAKNKYMVPLTSIYSQIDNAIRVYTKNDLTTPPQPKENKEEVNAISQFDKVVKDYQSAINSTKMYKERIELKNMENGKALMDWLDQISSALETTKKKLEASPNKNNDSVIKDYDQFLQSVVDKLGAFKIKYLVEGASQDE